MSLRYLTLILLSIAGLGFAQDGDEGVAFFERTQWRGRSQVYFESANRVPQGQMQRIRSVLVPPACTVVLYSEPNFRGRTLTFKNDLADTRLPNNFAVRSLRINRRAEVPRRDQRTQDQPGVVLFERVGFLGKEQIIRTSQPNLNSTHLGNDVLSSIRIPPGYTVTLYEHANYRGRMEVLHIDDDDLRDNLIGARRASSIHISYTEPPKEVAVTVFEHQNFSGRNAKIIGDIPDLARTGVGNDNISSIAVPPGYVVTLYEDSRYRGRSESFRADDRDLADNRIGNDNVSSIRIRREVIARPRGQVKLFPHSDFRGEPLTTRTDVANLGETQLGNDELSSIHIPKGWQVVLYRNGQFRGTEMVLTESIANMRNTPLGNDSVSSIRVIWIGANRRP